jgi:hypothetical protein
MKNWRTIGDAATTVAEWTGLCSRLRSVVEPYMDRNTNPGVLLEALALTMSWTVAQVDSRHHDRVAAILEILPSKIMDNAAEARKAGEAPIQ